MENEQYKPIAEAILANLPLVEEVEDIIDTLRNSNYGIADIIQDNAEMISAIRTGIKKLYFKGISEDDMTRLGNTAMYFTEILKISQNIILGIQMTSDSLDFTLTHDKAQTDELLQEYSYKAFSNYIIFISGLLSTASEDTMKSLSSNPDNMEIIESFMDYVKENEDFLQKYYTDDIEKVENVNFYEEDEESTKSGPDMSFDEIRWAEKKAARAISALDIVHDDDSE